MWRFPRDMMLSDGVITLSWPRASCTPACPPRLRSRSSSKKRLSLRLFCRRRDRRRRASRRSSAPLAFLPRPSVLLPKQTHETNPEFFNESLNKWITCRILKAQIKSTVTFTRSSSLFDVTKLCSSSCSSLSYSSPVLIGCGLHQDALRSVVKGNAVPADVTSIHAGVRRGEATGLR